MFTSRGIIKICILGGIASIGIRLYTPYGVLQAIADSCLASFIVTGLVTLKSYQDEKTDYLKQTYVGLKLLYHELSSISKYIQVLRKSTLAVQGDYMFASAKCVGLDEVEGRRIFLDDLRLSEISFNRLVVVSNYVGDCLRTLVKDITQVQVVWQVFKQKQLYLDVKIHMAELEKYTEELRELVGLCGNVYSHHITLRDTVEDSCSILKRFEGYMHNLGTKVNECSRLTYALKTQTDKLITEIESEIISSTGGSHWEREKRVVDSVAGWEIMKKSHDL